MENGDDVIEVSMIYSEGFFFYLVDLCILCGFQDIML